ELEHAVTIHQEALVNYQAVDDRRGLAWSATNLGMLAVELGDVSAGAGHLKDAIALYRELGDPSGIIVALGGFSGRAGGQERRGRVTSRTPLPSTGSWATHPASSSRWRVSRRSPRAGSGGTSRHCCSRPHRRCVNGSGHPPLWESVSDMSWSSGTFAGSSVTAS